jgi:hypothetical protein
MTYIGRICIWEVSDYSRASSAPINHSNVRFYSIAIGVNHVHVS